MDQDTIIISRLFEENKVLAAENAILRETIAQQATLIKKLEARIAELERRLGLNSSTVKDNNRRTRSLREGSTREPGGQQGHKGETLRQSAEPDTVSAHLYAVISCRGAFSWN
ncbi:MAG: DUF6444 domain-containing protein [Magnetococcus sp. YQC-9]